MFHINTVLGVLPSALSDIVRFSFEAWPEGARGVQLWQNAQTDQRARAALGGTSQALSGKVQDSGADFDFGLIVRLRISLKYMK